MAESSFPPLFISQSNVLPANYQPTSDLFVLVRFVALPFKCEWITNSTSEYVSIIRVTVVDGRLFLLFILIVFLLLEDFWISASISRLRSSQVEISSTKGQIWLFWKTSAWSLWMISCSSVTLLHDRT
jgi:hypothetical protein